jgi:Transposase and inactivated derivatives
MSGNQGKVRYSEAFKVQVVREYEQGASISSLRRKYGIGGSMTIKRWIERYGTRSPAVSGEGSSEEAEIRRLRRRIAWMEKTIARLAVEKAVLESTLEIYQQTYGKELAEKNGRRSSSGRERKEDRV